MSQKLHFNAFNMNLVLFIIINTYFLMKQNKYLNFSEKAHSSSFSWKPQYLTLCGPPEHGSRLLPECHWLYVMKHNLGLFHKCDHCEAIHYSMEISKHLRRSTRQVLCILDPDIDNALNYLTTCWQLNQKLTLEFGGRSMGSLRYETAQNEA